ncbi:hypothetical protein ACFFNY_04110 [Paenibacillus hodogayensis]|uniref:Uncharacterized protein n=1 Tax=Paenibacillus hodogayensis TaxID=279208 RepID=A0ABV5VR44_9BACL
MEASVNTREETLRTEEPAVFDPFYAEFKLADDLPQWLKLRYDICALLEKLMASKHLLNPADIDISMKAINDRIAAYNIHVPNAYLCKTSITPDNWIEEYEAWQ